jgi:hypothetical protein
VSDTSYDRPDIEDREPQDSEFLDEAKTQTEHAKIQTDEARAQTHHAEMQTRLFIISVVLGGASLAISLVALLRT